MVAEVKIAGEWELVKVHKVFRGARTTRCTMRGGTRVDLPTSLFFGELPTQSIKARPPKDGPRVA